MSFWNWLLGKTPAAPPKAKREPETLRCAECCNEVIVEYKDRFDGEVFTYHRDEKGRSLCTSSRRSTQLARELKANDDLKKSRGAK